MAGRRCLACGRSFQPRAQVPQQSYCTAAACQKERRRIWQRDRRRSDPDYRANQAAANRTWSEKHPDYWRMYRQSNPEYTQRNRAQQRARAHREKRSGVAKMDASRGAPMLAAGLYKLTRVTSEGAAKEDVWLVALSVVTRL